MFQMHMHTEKNTAIIKKLAGKYGFQYCGISKAEFLHEEAPRLEQWLKEQRHGKMQYMENHFDKRLDPTKLVPGAKSIVSLIYNYYPEEANEQDDSYKIAKYSYGKDYHFVIKDILKSFMEDVRQEIGDVNGRIFVDSAPVMERAWASRSGIGWTGKHTLLLNRNMGSFFFLAELILDLELVADGPAKDYCGTCTACIDSCPTDAILEPYKLDASKCISYLTIELKDEIPDSFQGKMNDWIFGCDICQDVCPWNRFARPHSQPLFKAHEQLGRMNKSEWEELTKDVFQEIFRKSAVKRAKFEGLKRNISFIKKARK